MTRINPEIAKKLNEAASASGKVRTDVRKSEMLSSDEVRSVSDGREIPVEALETPPGEIELCTVADTAHPDFPLEKFMEEKVTINVHSSSIEGDLPFVEPRVNGASAIIPRGRNVIVKRKFVEALANAKQSSYAQRVVNVDQANIQTPLEEQVALAFGFTLVNDTEQGRRWLSDLLKRAA